MQSSKLGNQAWAVAFYMAASNLKGISSLKLRRELETAQRAAWHMPQRIREVFRDGEGTLRGVGESDEVYTGGKDHNTTGTSRGSSRLVAEQWARRRWSGAGARRQGHSPAGCGDGARSDASTSDDMPRKRACRLARDSGSLSTVSVSLRFMPVARRSAYVFL